MPAVPKPNHKRRVPKRGTLSKITTAVRQEVIRRSEGKCERCGRTSAYSFEMAHLVQASQGGRGNDPANIVLLCGPSVNTGTCHNFADYTSAGREWRMKKREELQELYHD
jgi:5-methylcytosine-specific restriction endonuclease McrA